MNTADPTKISRKAQILQSLAHMLETHHGERITTAQLAKEVGVSEAALYRHFPSKAKMFEGLIEFIEETIFTRITRILAEEQSAIIRCEQMLFLILSFSEKNPGMSRILSGDALTGETDRLRVRICHLFDRIETQFKQVLREADMREGIIPIVPITASCSLFISFIEGRIRHFVRSEFKRLPTESWRELWPCLSNELFATKTLLLQ
jgi:TetR/AcrR family transcriptional regulator